MQQVTEHLIVPPPTIKDLWVDLKYPSKSVEKTRLSFGEDAITFVNKFRNQVILYNDLIGYKHSVEDRANSVHKFVVNSFPKRPKKCNRNLERVIQQKAFWSNLNEEELENLKQTLLRQITSAQQIKHLLIYLNPNAGANSIKHLQTVQQFLTYSNFPHTLIETTHRGHCKEHLDSLDLSKYHGIVIISGDGLMHQFVNSKACGRIPVTHVPGGSGNAFSKMQTTLAGELCRDQEAMFLAIKGRTKHMNLMKVELENHPEPIYSFMSLEWAFLADIDLNSQFLRCLGGLRFEIYAAYRCIALRRYPGKITYSLTPQPLPSLSQPITQPSFKIISTVFLNSIFLVMPFISDKYQWGPLIKVEDQIIQMQLTTLEQGRMQLIKYLLSSDSGDHFDKEKKEPKEGFRFQYQKVKSFRLQPEGEGDLRGLFGIDGERYEAQRMQACFSDRKVITFA